MYMSTMGSLPLHFYSCHKSHKIVELKEGVYLILFLVSKYEQVVCSKKLLELGQMSVPVGPR